MTLWSNDPLEQRPFGAMTLRSIDRKDNTNTQEDNLRISYCFCFNYCARLCPFHSIGRINKRFRSLRGEYELMNSDIVTIDLMKVAHAELNEIQLARFLALRFWPCVLLGAARNN